MERIPLLIVYTGNGKGKTTAALGVIFRALGHEGVCAVIQFIKPATLETGEKKTAKRLGVLWENYGEGFLWKEKESEPSRKACRKGWQRAQELIQSQQYDLIVLDEFTYPLEHGFVTMSEVVEFFSNYKKGERPPHVIITGRNAPQELLDIADMVHELVEIKHPWHLAKVRAQPMVEY
ncbi:MAG: cob(I)yrinic acid a,c-diamide adenosyltransferase [Sphaerochaetaceae bacterium]|nr:cob(I)yrinic acid a,c-diamide adenosyltransferase [Sphaerochaetaceae bacterium]